MIETQGQKDIRIYTADYAVLNKNYCHNPLFVPSARGLDFEVLEMPEFDTSGNLISYKLKRIYGTVNGSYNENEELEKGCIVGYEKWHIHKHKKDFPDIKVRFGRGLSNFDRKLLLRFLGQVQYQKKIAKEYGLHGDSIKNYRLFFSNELELGKFLDIKNPSNYKQRILESLCKLAATGVWFVNSYYRYKRKHKDRGEGELARDICHFNFIDTLKIDSEGITIQLCSGWVDEHEGHFITSYFKKDEKLRSEISFNLKNLLEACSKSFTTEQTVVGLEKPVREAERVLTNPLRRELLNLCRKLGFSETAAPTDLRRYLRESIEDINNLHNTNYKISFEKNKNGDEIVIFSDRDIEEYKNEEKDPELTSSKGKIARYLD